MSQKTKTIIKETEDVSERDNPAVLAYRVRQLEIGQERGFAEVKQQNVDLLNKMDTLANNFATKADLDDVTKQGKDEHEHIEVKIAEGDARLESRINKVEGWLTWAGRIVIGAVIAAVLGLVIVNRSSL